VLSFVDELSAVVGLIVVDSPENVVLLGDFNCPGTDPSSVDDRLSVLFESFGLTKVFVGPTCGNNQFDVRITIDSTLVNNAKPDDGNLISDGSLITANFLIRRNAKQTIHYSYWPLRSFDFVQFDMSIRRSEPFTIPASDVDEYVDQLCRIVIGELDKVAPLHCRVCRTSKPNSSWLSAEAVTAKRERRRLEIR
jgi:hypothetical protein